MIAPGQTTKVLLTADQVPDSSDMFAMAATTYVSSIFPFDNSTMIAFFCYKPFKTLKPETLASLTSIQNLPRIRDAAFATEFSGKLRTLHPVSTHVTFPRRLIKEW